MESNVVILLSSVVSLLSVVMAVFGLVLPNGNKNLQVDVAKKPETVEVKKSTFAIGVADIKYQAYISSSAESYGNRIKYKTEAILRSVDKQAST